jgi:hypothetical protein
MLLENEELRNDYGAVKQVLVNSGLRSMSKYCRGKNEIVLKILEKAGWDRHGQKVNAWIWISANVCTLRTVRTVSTYSLYR